MRDTDDIDDLLARARETLKAEILPQLPPDRLYPALTVLTALGIAQRQRRDGAGRRMAALAALAPFAGEAGTLTAAKTELARRLRADPAAGTPGLHAALVAVTRAGCAESNPKARALSGLPEEG